MITIINGTECYVTWSCLDVNGNPYVPTSLSYQVFAGPADNPTQVGTAKILTAAQTGTITLDSTTNSMVTGGQFVGGMLIENRKVILKVGIPGGSYRNDVTAYQIAGSPGTP